MVAGCEKKVKKLSIHPYRVFAAIFRAFNIIALAITRCDATVAASGQVIVGCIAQPSCIFAVKGFGGIVPVIICGGEKGDGFIEVNK